MPPSFHGMYASARAGNGVDHWSVDPGCPRCNQAAPLFKMPCGCRLCQVCVEKCYSAGQCSLGCSPWTSAMIGPLFMRATSHDLDALLAPALLAAARRDYVRHRYHPNRAWLNHHWWVGNTVEIMRQFARDFGCLPSSDMLLPFLKQCEEQGVDCTGFLSVPGFRYPLDVLLWCQRYGT